MKTSYRVLFAFLPFISLTTGAQVFSVAYNFGALVGFTNGDGSQYQSQVGTTLLQAQDGGLYGLAAAGGIYGSGVVFRYSPDTGYRVVHAFTANPNQTNYDGAYPQGALIQTGDGNFYGTAAGGGTNGNYGTVFKMTTNGVITLLHSFNYSDGENPATALFPAGGGVFYGTVILGGTNGGGSIFQVGTNGKFVQLHDFSGTAQYSNNVTHYTTYTNSDGTEPYGALASGNDGWLYGTTKNGGTNGNGTIYRYNTNNGAFTLLHTFSATTNASYFTNWDGANPTAGLTLYSNGVFWGTAEYGGTNGYGAIFQITTGGVFTVLHTFNLVVEGGGAAAGLTRGRDGNFYSTVYEAAFGYGTVYQFTTNGVFNPLHIFNPLNAPSTGGSDGGNPVGGVTFGSDGYLYGTTTSFGAYTNGTIYRIIYPGLSIANLPGRQVLVYWPTNQAGFTLQVNTNLATTNWLTATPAPSVLNDQYVVTNDATVPKSFYRLKK